MLYASIPDMNQEYLNESHLDSASEEPIQQFTHIATGEMTQKGIRIKVKIQAFSIEAATRELVSLYCSIEDEFKARNIPLAPVELKNGLKA
jgi:hypothetical protein